MGILCLLIVKLCTIVEKIFNRKRFGKYYLLVVLDDPNSFEYAKFLVVTSFLA